MKHGAECLGDQLGVRQFMGQRDDHVEVVFQQVGLTLGKHQVHGHFGVALVVAPGKRGE